MTCHLVTAKKASDHISSADDGSMYSSVFGWGRFVVKQGDDLAISVESANSVVIGTGACFIDGRYFRVTADHTVSIDSGGQSVNRNDLVGVKYEFDSQTGYETGDLVVVKGTAVSGDPEDPTYTDGNINEGAQEAFYPLYRIPVRGISIETPEALFSFMDHSVMCPWPIGSILQMTNSNDPNDAYPGTTWTAIQGRFLLASSSSYNLGATGGEASHTLSANEMPSHGHSVTGGSHSHYVDMSYTYTEAAGYGLTQSAGFTNRVVIRAPGVKWNSSNTSHSHPVSNAGGSQAHNNMPPYKVVNMWERTA